MDPQEGLTVAHLHTFVRHTCDRLDTMRTAMLEGFARVDTRLTQVETRLTHVETRLDQLDMRLNQLDGRLLQLDSRLGRLESGGLPPPTLLVWICAGVALVLSLIALWR